VAPAAVAAVARTTGVKKEELVSDEAPALKRRTPQDREAWWSAAVFRTGLIVIAASSLGAGLIFQRMGHPERAGWIWIGGVLPVLATLIVEIATCLGRGEFGLDIVAALSMAGSLAVGQPLAGVVVGLMYSGGQGLEQFAQQRARRELTALLAHVPRTIARYGEDGLHETPIEAITPGDRLLIRHGEVVPVDGLAQAAATIDVSTLTGESKPVERQPGQEIPSGATSLGQAFDLITVRPAAASTHARIVKLVETAGQAKSRLTRLADRFSLFFLVVTLVVAGAAWIVSGSGLRALAVLVTATPCPLILAAPVAVVSGVSRCASLGLLLKGGGVLESLATIRVVVLDKTGTVTRGEPSLIAVRSSDGWSGEEIVRLAASLDQASKHVTASAIVRAARQRGLALASPEQLREDAGRGLAGVVEGHAVLVGSRAFVSASLQQPELFAETKNNGAGPDVVAVAIDGDLAGELELADSIRAETVATIAALRRAGVEQVMLASGDAASLTRAIAQRIGVDHEFGEQSPEDKVHLVIDQRRIGPVLMVGDGVNDAPALAAADVSIALGARGAVASSEVADAVLLVDRIDPVANGLVVAQRARRIARQSIVIGMALSFTAMGFAFAGALPPVQGALVQEVIDVLVILNALRAGLPAANVVQMPAAG
jgi:heavy metal translocating P-type ATPase